MKRKMLPLILAATLGIAFQAAQAEIKPLNRIAMEVKNTPPWKGYTKKPKPMDTAAKPIA